MSPSRLNFQMMMISPLPSPDHPDRIINIMDRSLKIKQVLALVVFVAIIFFLGSAFAYGWLVGPLKSLFGG